MSYTRSLHFIFVTSGWSGKSLFVAVK